MPYKIYRFFKVKKLILLSSLLFSCFSLVYTNVFAQCPVSNTSSLTASNDTTINCGVNCTNLSVISSTTTLASTNTYTVSSIPYAPFSFTGGTSILVNIDDVWSAVVPMPFPFCFFGTKYTSCVVGANGQLGFDLSQANAFNNWSMASGLPAGPTPAAVRNAILGPYHDLDPAVSGGSVHYATYGTAPCRTFVVSWSTVPYFSCNALLGTQQIVLYESTNIIEINMQNKPVCAAWNGGLAITGINNAAGTVWYTAPGENGTQFTATNQSWRFTPSGTPTWTYRWYSSLSPLTQIGTGSPITVCPGVTTRYYVEGVATSNCDSVIVWDSVLVTKFTGNIINIRAVTTTNPTLCGACDGTVKLYGVTPGQADTVFTTLNGVPQPPFLSTAASDSTMTFTGLCQGAYTYYVKVSCPSNTVSATLTMPPPIPASFTDVIHLGCNGDAIILNNTTSPATYHSYWDFGDGSPIDSTDVSPTHIYLDNPGYVGTYTVTLTYNPTHDPACITQYSIPVSFNHPIDAHIVGITPDTSVCAGIPMEFYGNSISQGPSFSWNFGDNITASGSVAPPGSPGPDMTTYTYPLAGDYTVKLTVTDSIGCPAIDSAHVHVISISVRTANNDTSVCLADSMSMYAIVTVKPNTMGYTGAWTPTNNIGNNTFAGTGDGEYMANFFGLGDYVYTFTATIPYPFCWASDTGAIHSYPPVTLTNLTASQTIPWGGSIQLNADGAVYYTWAPDNGTLDNPNINNPNATPTDSVTKYTVYAMSLYGCLDSAHITISLGNMTEFVPSAFTPNGDGLNDVFRITNTSFQKLVDFRIFNRWGQQVFQTANREVGWDGTWKGVPQDVGVYTYRIIIGLVDGTLKTYKGNVTLIR